MAISYIELGCPWQPARRTGKPPCIESFNGRFRDEVLDCELFTSPANAQLVAGQWRETYNHLHPHSSLGMLAPAVLAERWAAEHGGRDEPVSGSDHTRAASPRPQIAAQGLVSELRIRPFRRYRRIETSRS